MIGQSLETNITKCCGESFEARVEDNSTLNCVESPKSRLQVLSNSRNFLENDGFGKCVDVEEGNFYRYTVNDSMLEAKEPLIDVRIFPKCCPLNHYYDIKTRSCQSGKDVDERYVLQKSPLVKIGLPHCEVITDSTFKSYMEASSHVYKFAREGDYCFDTDLYNNFVVRECKGLQICEKKRCFRKCCPDGQSYVQGSNCQDTYVHGVKLKNTIYSDYIKDIDDDFEIINGVGCRKVSLLFNNTIQYNIKKNGEYTYYYNLTSKFESKAYNDRTSYCIEHATKGKMNDYYMFWCLAEAPLEDKFTLTLWTKILSVVCLLITVVVYFILGEHRNTFGKILINYSFAMCSLMILLTIVHLTRRSSRIECKIKAYILIFFNIAAFAWVNVMSLDIWCTFGTPKRTIGSDQRRKDLKKFLLYFSYGWGLPLCHTLLILFFDLQRVLPESIQPHIGIFKCFLENRRHSRTLFFLAPQLLFQIVNIVLFIKTTVYCIRVKNEIKKMNDSVRSGKYNADKGRLALVVKLAVIMGVVWTCEVTTAFFPNMHNYNNFTKKLEIFMDSITCLQGVFIFLIFICKKRTTVAIRKKLGLGVRRISGSMSMTQTSQVNGNFPMYKSQTTFSLSDVKQ